MFSIVLLLLFTPGSCESQSSFFCSINCEQKSFLQQMWSVNRRSLTAILTLIASGHHLSITLYWAASSMIFTIFHNLQPWEEETCNLLWQTSVFLLYKQQQIIASCTLQHKIFIVYNVKHLTFLVVKNFSSHLCSKWWKSTK